MVARQGTRYKNATAGVGIGFGGQKAWSIPANLPDAWWLDPIGAPETLTYAAQPLFLNTGFDNGSAWSYTGSGWTIGSGVASHAAVGSGSCIQSVLTLGNRYTWNWTLSSLSAGSIRPYIGLGNARTPQTVPATYYEEGTAVTDTYAYWYATADTVASIDNCGANARNWSLAAVSPRQGAGDFAVATAVNQPWLDSVSGGIRFDALGDYLVSTAPASSWNFLHSPAGSCVVAVIHINTANVYNAIFATADGALASNVGVCAFINGGRVYFRVQNGTISYTVSSPVGTITTGIKYLVSFTVGATHTIRVNGAQVASGPSSGTSALNASFPLIVSGWTTATSTPHRLDGVLYELVATDNVAELAHLERYLSVKHGITLA